MSDFLTFDQKLGKLAELIKNRTITTIDTKHDKYQTDCDKHGKYVEADIHGVCAQCARDFREERKEQQLATLRLRMLSESGVGVRYHNANFQNAPIAQQSVVNELQAYKFDRNIMLIGKTGTGKTHLAMALINTVITSTTCQFVKFYKLLDIQINDKHKFHEIRTCKFLVIDDLGIADTANKHVVLHEVLDYRYDNCLPTMITSNLTKSQLEESLSDALYSRIKSDCLSLVLGGEDKRLTRGAL